MPWVPRISGRIVSACRLVTRVGSCAFCCAPTVTARRTAVPAIRNPQSAIRNVVMCGRLYRMLGLVKRPLVIIFLTIFVNLVGFGIIIPLLPFYAETFGASPLVIGLLFAIFSLSQLIATPALGVLSDRWGRRPVLIFSLLGTVVSFAMLAVARSLAVAFAARIIDGLS